MTDGSGNQTDIKPELAWFAQQMMNHSDTYLNANQKYFEISNPMNMEDDMAGNQLCYALHELQFAIQDLIYRTKDTKLSLVSQKNKAQDIGILAAMIAYGSHKNIHPAKKGDYQTSNAKFMNGSMVKVVNMGAMYSGYHQWASRHMPLDYTFERESYSLQPESICEVICSGPHVTIENDIIYGIAMPYTKKLWVIGEGGLEAIV